MINVKYLTNNLFYSLIDNPNTWDDNLDEYVPENKYGIYKKYKTLHQNMHMKEGDYVQIGRILKGVYYVR